MEQWRSQHLVIRLHEWLLVHLPLEVRVYPLPPPDDAKAPRDVSLYVFLYNIVCPNDKIALWIVEHYVHSWLLLRILHSCIIWLYGNWNSVPGVDSAWNNHAGNLST